MLGDLITAGFRVPTPSRGLHGVFIKKASGVVIDAHGCTRISARAYDGTVPLIGDAPRLLDAPLNFSLFPSPNLNLIRTNRPT